MQTFICPQCSQRSAFDPWVESAHCPQCGYRNIANDPFISETPCHQCAYKPPGWEKNLGKVVERRVNAAKEGDHQRARNILVTVLELGASAEQEATALLWLAEVTPNLYQKQDYLKKALRKPAAGWVPRWRDNPASRNKRYPTFIPQISHIIPHSLIHQLYKI